MLREMGAQVVDVPLTRIVPAAPDVISGVLARLHEYDWIAFTSANAVNQFWRGLAASGRDTRALANAKVCSVGRATSRALQAHGLSVDVESQRFVAEGLVEALTRAASMQGVRVLHPCAEGARATLQVGLEAAGATVHRVHTYSSEPDPSASASIGAELESGKVDMIAFTSESAVRAFTAAVDPEAASRAPAASIGPTTTAALRDAGMNVVAQADEASLEALAGAIVAFLVDNA
jgi:uroporphyrinogen III methyltransferase/synthase